MNKGFNAQFDEDIKTVSQEDMVLINSYSQKELKPEEIFTFSVVLCDNEIDRDFERFTVSSIQTLAKLFTGKTAIKNHSNNSEDQSARTYKTEVITDNEKMNSLGEPYVYLKAYCYMPKIEKNEALIAEIQAGIKKEVSIGCAVEKSICSVCGTDARSSACQHRRGRKYKGETCFFELVNPTDAYEWSFVAVPAQKNAGVTKSFCEKEVRNTEDIIKSLKSAQENISLSADECRALCKVFDELKEKAAYGEEYRAELEKETVKLFAFTMPQLSNDYTQSICKSMSIRDLKELYGAMKENRPQVNTSAQLLKAKQGKETETNSQFRF